MEKTTNEVAVIGDNELASVHQFRSLNDFRLALQGFSNRINQAPDPKAVGQTADGNAKTIYISHVEMTLDEYFFGLWETENFRWQLISNEVVGSIDLVFTHPVTGLKYRRTGAASIQIMVDAVPDDLKFNKNDDKETAERRKKDRNQWALDVQNKKPAALDMGFPKLKAECVKNAALSLGKLFGRDLNRDTDKSDSYNPLVKKIVEIPEELREVIKTAEFEAIGKIWANNKEYQNNPEFMQLLNARKQELKPDPIDNAQNPSVS